MSKKSRLKRRKFQYTKTEFITAVCNACELCKPNTDPTFCYTNAYLENPKKFFKEMLPEMKEMRACLDSLGFADISACPDSDIQDAFEMAFCPSCSAGSAGGGPSCDYFAGCVLGFRKQIAASEANLTDVTSYRQNNRHNRNRTMMSSWRKVKKQKQSPKPAPIPSFFCNDGFKKEVDRIINGSHTGKQNKGQKSTGSAEATPDGQASSSQS